MFIFIYPQSLFQWFCQTKISGKTITQAFKFCIQNRPYQMKIAQMRFIICIQGSNWSNRKVLGKRIFEGESGAKFSCKAKINR